MAAFWNVAPCSLVEFTDVSEVIAASTVRAPWLWRQQARWDVAKSIPKYIVWK
jgi:hypothetical protein